MQIPIYFVRTFFAILCSVFMTVYMISLPMGTLLMKILAGIGLGGIFSLCAFSFDTFFRKCHLRTFNILTLGLFFGYLLGRAVNLVFHALLSLTFLAYTLPQPVVELLQVGLFLFCVYLGTITTLAWAHEVALSIPFITLSKQQKGSKKVLIDLSAITDLRSADLASSHLLDELLIVPNWMVKELRCMSESLEDDQRNRGRKGLDVLKKLEGLAHLKVRYHDMKLSDHQNPDQKIQAMARALKCHILTAAPPGQTLCAEEGLHFISLQTLSHALKPLIPTGDNITIKVQRYGKEPKQGVGYLEDGTMVVINNGGDFIGETIETQVISIKQTSAGRIIFTNAMISEENLKLRSPAYESMFENE